MTAIRVIFDGKAFVPQQPVSIAPQTEAVVLVEGSDPAAPSLDEAMRQYYLGGEDPEDESWARATAQQSRDAWDGD